MVADGEPVDGGHVGDRQARSGAVVQRATLPVEEQHRAAGSGDQPLQRIEDLGEHVVQRGGGRDQLEHLGLPVEHVPGVVRAEHRRVHPGELGGAHPSSTSW